MRAWHMNVCVCAVARARARRRRIGTERNVAENEQRRKFGQNWAFLTATVEPENPKKIHIVCGKNIEGSEIAQETQRKERKTEPKFFPPE